MAPESRKGHRGGEGSDTRRDLDRRIAREAAQRRNLITAKRLRELGLSANGIRSRAATGRLHPLLIGVYSTAPPPFDRRQRWLAALLASGAGSLLSHFQSAALLGIAAQPPGPTHVTVPPDSGRRPGQRAGIVIHRSAVEARDAAGRDGIPCTSAARTIVDLAALLGPAELEPVLIAADSLRILNRRRLFELVGESSGRRGIRTLRSLLAIDPVRVRSTLETDLLQIIRTAGLPEPIINGRVAGIEVDFHWPALRLVAEADGWRFHGGRERANADRDRDQRLLVTGWRVIRFTRDQIVAEPERCARRLAAVATCSGR